MRAVLLMMERKTPIIYMCTDAGGDFHERVVTGFYTCSHLRMHICSFTNPPESKRTHTVYIVLVVNRGFMLLVPGVSRHNSQRLN